MILLSRRFDILNIYINIMLPDILRCIPAVLFKFTTAMFVGPVAYMSLYDDMITGFGHQIMVAQQLAID